MDQTRPGALELYGKVKAALAALNSGLTMVAVPDHLASDLADIGVESATEFWAILPDLLRELDAAGPGGCYAGWRPDPEKSGEPLVKGLKLWAFAWDSQRLGFEVYLKFCLVPTRAGEMCYGHVRIHTNRPPSTT